ncbi:hypothetical protein GF385_01745 [Candidatus Dependentiae bacterium]|nr:hypothetical protein [Candidatus Dependentiae bacterium]
MKTKLILLLSIFSINFASGMKTSGNNLDNGSIEYYIQNNSFKNPYKEDVIKETITIEKGPSLQKLQEIEDMLKALAIFQIQQANNNEYQTPIIINNKTDKNSFAKTFLVEGGKILGSSLLTSIVTYLLFKKFDIDTTSMNDQSRYVKIKKFNKAIESNSNYEVKEGFFTSLINYLMRTDIVLLNPKTWPKFLEKPSFDNI